MWSLIHVFYLLDEVLELCTFYYIWSKIISAFYIVKVLLLFTKYLKCLMKDIDHL